MRKDIKILTQYCCIHLSVTKSIFKNQKTPFYILRKDYFDSLKLIHYTKLNTWETIAYCCIMIHQRYTFFYFQPYILISIGKMKATFSELSHNKTIFINLCIKTLNYFCMPFLIHILLVNF